MSIEEIETLLNSKTSILNINLEGAVNFIINRFSERRERQLDGVISELLVDPLIRLFHLSRLDTRMLVHSIIGGLQDDTNQSLDQFVNERMETQMIRNIRLEEERKRKVLKECCLFALYISRKALADAIMNLPSSITRNMQVRNNGTIQNNNGGSSLQADT